MSSWSEGYATNELYEFSYFPELHPQVINSMLTYAGFAVPDFSSGNAFELGFGFGVSTIVNHLTSSLNWYGNDFNPSQCMFAQGLAKSIGIKDIHLTDQSFAQLNEDKSLPKFKFIMLHGIYTWINRENQKEIIKFIDEHLEEGGVLYISYNTAPRFLVQEPLRYALNEYADEYLAANTPLEQRIKESRELLRELERVKAGYLDAAKDAIELAVRLENAQPSYINGEYFNENWHIFHATDIMKDFGDIGLQFVSSANAVELNRDSLYPKNFGEFIAKYQDDVELCETINDIYSNTQFRKDIFVRGARKLTPQEQDEALAKLSFCLNPTVHQLQLELYHAGQSLNVKAELCTNVLNYFSSGEIHTYRELRDYMASLDLAKILGLPDLDLKDPHVLNKLLIECILNFSFIRRGIFSFNKDYKVDEQRLEMIKQFNVRFFTSKETDDYFHAMNYLGIAISPYVGGFIMHRLYSSFLRIVAKNPKFTRQDYRTILRNSIVFDDEGKPSIEIPDLNDDTPKTKEEFYKLLDQRIDRFFDVERDIYRRLKCWNL